MAWHHFFFAQALGYTGGDEAFKATSVELSHVKLCRDNSLLVKATLKQDPRDVAAARATTRLPLTIRLGLDLEEGGRQIIVRQPELVSKGLFGREVYVPFMPLAKSGADLGPDFHLSKLLIKEGVMEAEGIVVVRPPGTLTAEQEIALLEGRGAAMGEEIQELRRVEMQQRELDSRAKEWQLGLHRMEVEGEIRMARYRAAERRRRRQDRLLTVTQATRNLTGKALSPLDALRTNLSSYVSSAAASSSLGVNAYVNVSAVTHYVNVSAVSSYVNSTAYAQYMRGVDMRRRLDEELAHYNASGYTALLAQKLRRSTMGARAPSGTRRIRSASSASTNASLSPVTTAGENTSGPTTGPAPGAAARRRDGEPLASGGGGGGGGGSEGRGDAATWWGKVVRQGVLAGVVSKASSGRGGSLGLRWFWSLAWSKQASGGPWARVLTRAGQEWRVLTRAGQEWRRRRTESTRPSARCWTYFISFWGVNDGWVWERARGECRMCCA